MLDMLLVKRSPTLSEARKKSRAVGRRAPSRKEPKWPSPLRLLMLPICVSARRRDPANGGRRRGPGVVVERTETMTRRAKLNAYICSYVSRRIAKLPKDGANADLQAFPRAFHHALRRCKLKLPRLFFLDGNCCLAFEHAFVSFRW